MSATLVSNDGWFPASWRGYPARQMPEYADPQALRAVETRLAAAAPVVRSEDSARLREAVAELVTGKGFLLQGGDCAESFDDQVAEQVAGIVGLFDAMAEQLRPAIGGSLVEIARIAGQFAKPRSATIETHEGVSLPAYRGDIVNGSAFEVAVREADPQRMMRAHMQSVGTAASLAAARGANRPIFTSHSPKFCRFASCTLCRETEPGFA